MLHVCLFATMSWAHLNHSCVCGVCCVTCHLLLRKSSLWRSSFSILQRGCFSLWYLTLHSFVLLEYVHLTRYCVFGGWCLSSARDDNYVLHHMYCILGQRLYHMCKFMGGHTLFITYNEKLILALVRWQLTNWQYKVWVRVQFVVRILAFMYVLRRCNMTSRRYAIKGSNDHQENAQSKPEAYPEGGRVHISRNWITSSITTAI